MKEWLKRNAAMLILLAALPLALLIAGRGIMTRVSREGAENAERGLRRAALECYALEGFYPADPEYLYSRYGVEIDTDRYIVHYESAGGNLMPDISVFEAAGEVPQS